MAIVSWRRRNPSELAALPTDVDERKIEAVCKDGVLSVTLPKAEKSKAVKVAVKG
jgi:HSP20 family molecular chaperone IbpA